MTTLDEILDRYDHPDTEFKMDGPYEGGNILLTITEPAITNWGANVLITKYGSFGGRDQFAFMGWDGLPDPPPA